MLPKLHVVLPASFALSPCATQGKLDPGQLDEIHRNEARRNQAHRNQGHHHQGHRVLLQGKGKLAIVDHAGAIEWQMPWGGIHDLHALPSGNIMVQRGAHSVVEIDRATKKIAWQYDSSNQNGNAGKRVEVHAFQPLDDGRVMIAESGPARIIEVDRSGALLAETLLKVDRPHPHTSFARSPPIATSSATKATASFANTSRARAS